MPHRSGNIEGIVCQYGVFGIKYKAFINDGFSNLFWSHFNILQVIIFGKILSQSLG